MGSAATNVMTIGAGILLLNACGADELAPAEKPSGLFVAAMPSGFTFEQRTHVELTSSRPAEIYYSTDGRTPTAEDGTRYDGPIEITDSTLLSFIAISGDGVWSAPGSELYRPMADNGAPELVPRILDLEQDVLFFDARPGRRDRVERSLRLRSRGNESVRVQAIYLAKNRSSLGFYEEGVFRIEAGAESRLLGPGETMDVVMSYEPTSSFRGATLVIESDEQRHGGIQTVELWGRVLDW